MTTPSRLVRRADAAATVAGLTRDAPGRIRGHFRRIEGQLAGAGPRKSDAPGKSDAESENAIDLLKADHREVDQLFEQFKSTKGRQQRKKLVRLIARPPRIRSLHMDAGQSAQQDASRGNHLGSGQEFDDRWRQDRGPSRGSGGHGGW